MTYDEALVEAEIAAAEFGADREGDWDGRAEEWLHATAMRILAEDFDAQYQAMYDDPAQFAAVFGYSL
jgi:hypothetical protein